nr:acyloxyacyl hydrolase [Allomuricauda sp.]
MGTPINLGKLSCICVVLFLGTPFWGNAQRATSYEKGIQRMGFNYGQGTQQSFPFASDSYTYDVTYVKFNYNRSIINGKKLRLGINIEPGIYFSTEGEFPKIETDNTEVKAVSKGGSEETQALVMDYRKMNEYVLDIGVQMSYPIQKNLDWYLLGSVGPMIIDTQTQRQKKGFAFSDIFSMGLLYHLKNLVVDLRYGIRHVSNAGFGRPNKGYNSTNFEMGFSIPLGRTNKI